MSEKTKLNKFLNDVQEYLFLLRRHSFLRYQTDGREYNVRRMVVIDGIVKALEHITSVSIPAVYDEIPVESVAEVSVASTQRLIRQTVRNMRQSLHSFEPHSSIARGYGKAIQRWERALFALREYLRTAQ